MNMKKIINIITCRNFMENAKLKLKHDIVFLRANGYMWMYVNICNVSKTPVGSQGSFQKMVFIKSYFKSTKEHPLGRVVAIKEECKSFPDIL